MIPSDPTFETTARSLSRSFDFNRDWRFRLVDHPDSPRPDLDDSDWRLLHLPHDWSVEFPYDEAAGEGATGYLPGGVGWYRKEFEIESGAEALHAVLFDGVYNNAEFWLNGTSLGVHPYGYTPALFDLTPLLKPPGERNLLAVRVDHHRSVDSRWYTGSGIYRNVRLIRKAPLHIPVWGISITTPEVTPTRALVNAEIAVRNASDLEREFLLRTCIVDPQGWQVAERETNVLLPGRADTVCRQGIEVVDPDLWDPDRPHLYRAVTEVVEGDRLAESCETRFGIRWFRFDPDHGFFLNGEPTPVQGVCLHHDAGLVGAAVPPGVWRRRLLKLKDLGCNAIRTAHNPASEEFLTLCDELGFLVQEEFFDEWDYPKDKRLNMKEKKGDELTRGYTEHFRTWAQRDLEITVRRDRNHPCIFQWSIGNEIEWTYPRYAAATGYFDANADGNYFWIVPPYSADEIQKRFEDSPEETYVLAETAHRLARWTREADPTRPVVSNCILPSVSHVSGYTDALDVVGYSYRQVMYDSCHERYPDTVIMGTENLGQWHEWKHVEERAFICGLFIWTGIHYLGEAHQKWPCKGTGSGLLDFAGFEHGAFHMMKSLWRKDEPHVHITTQTLAASLYEQNEDGEVVEKEPGGWARRLWTWPDVNNHWNYADGEPVVVEVCSNCDVVELYVDGNSLGTRRPHDQEDRLSKWIVPHRPGILEAVGRHPTGKTARYSLVSAGAPAAILLQSDTSQLEADGRDVAHVVAQLVDSDGRPVRHLEREIQFSVDGPCRSLGVDNGAVDNVQPHQSDRIVTSQGRALLILQSETRGGTIKVLATAATLESGTLRVESGARGARASADPAALNAPP